MQVEAARSGPVREVIAATGVVTAAPGAELVVTAPEAARIVELPKAEGDRVRAGDLLVRFEIPSLTAGARARAAPRSSRRRRASKTPRRAAARVAGLFERGVAARKEVEDAERELREANAALAQAQSASGAANALAGRTVVRAQFDGVVAKRCTTRATSSSRARAIRSCGSSIRRVSRSSPPCRSATLARIAADAPAHIIDPGGDEPIEAARDRAAGGSRAGQRDRRRAAASGIGSGS